MQDQLDRNPISTENVPTHMNQVVPRTDVSHYDRILTLADTRWYQGLLTNQEVGNFFADLSG